MNDLSNEKRYYKVWRHFDKFDSLITDCKNYKIQIVERNNKEQYLICFCDEHSLNMSVLRMDYEVLQYDYPILDKTKKTIVVVHGLGGGIKSKTCAMLKEHFKDRYNVITPEVPINPQDAVIYLTKLINDVNPTLVVGTSLGGFYSLLSSKRSKLLLINPALRAYDNILNSPNIQKGVLVEYTKERLNNEIKYIVDDQFISDLKDLQNKLEESISTLLFNDIYAIFGKEDKLFSNITYYIDNYNKDNMLVIPNMEHSLSVEQVSAVVIPKAEELLNDV